MRLVITEHHYSDIASAERIAADAGIDLVVGRCASEDEALDLARDADGIVCQHVPVTEAMLDAWPRCRVVAHFGKGVDNIDVDAATRRGIWVTNVRDANADEVSNHVLALALCWARGLPAFDAHVRSGGWSHRGAVPRRRLAGQTLGLVGFGDVARLLARKAAGLGLEVVAFARRPTTAPGVAFLDLDEVLRRADILSIHVPLNRETRQLIGARELARMKPTAMLVNTARGAIVDQGALVAALRSGGIAAAGLDVLDPEPPPPDDPILSLPNVILTPHAAWYSEESRERVTTAAVRDAVAVLRGGVPESPVNPDVAPAAARRAAALGGA